MVKSYFKLDIKQNNKIKNKNRTSFFNFFRSFPEIKITPNSQITSTLHPTNNPQCSKERERANIQANLMDDDYHLGLFIKDDFVPLALEYYLGINPESSGEDDDDSDSDI